MRRIAALLLAGPHADGACPDGVDPDGFVRALAEDVLDVLVGLAGVRAAIAHDVARSAEAEQIRWPGTGLYPLVTADPPRPAALAALDACAADGYQVAAVVAPDAPDLPDLVLAKPFSALSSSAAAVIPARGGGLVALAARLPLPSWLASSGVGLDSHDAVERLSRQAPRRRDVRVAPSWHRLRTPTDRAQLDPALEGWDRTRMLLGV